MAEASPHKGMGPVKIILLILCGMVVLATGALVLYHMTLSAQIQKRLDAIRAEGFPVTLEELDAWYPAVAEAENAATVYGQAFAAYAEYPTSGERAAELPIVGTAKLPARNQPIDDQMKARISGYLEANAEALQLIHKAAGMEKCRFPIDLRQGAGVLLPHLASMRQGARLLHVEGVLRIEEGRGGEAARSVIDTVKLSRALSKEPLLISSLVRIASLSIGRANLERVLSRMTLSDADLAALSKAFEAAEEPEAWSRGMVGERCKGIAILQSPRQAIGMNLGETVNISPWMIPALRLSWMLKREEIRYLDVMGKTVDLAQMPAVERAQALNSGLLEELESKHHGIFAAVLLPALSRATTEDTKCVARLRTARAALAVERYRLKYGRLPESVKALVPEFLPQSIADPFDGQPLRYLRQETGYIVYSVGEDGVDDQGTEEENRGKPDVTFTVER